MTPPTCVLAGHTRGRKAARARTPLWIAAMARLIYVLSAPDIVVSGDLSMRLNTFVVPRAVWPLMVRQSPIFDAERPGDFY